MMWLKRWLPHLASISKQVAISYIQWNLEMLIMNGLNLLIHFARVPRVVLLKRIQQGGPHKLPNTGGACTITIVNDTVYTGHKLSESIHNIILNVAPYRLMTYCIITAELDLWHFPQCFDLYPVGCFWKTVLSPREIIVKKHIIITVTVCILSENCSNALNGN